ncbi:hypothetical protein HMSSN036_67210 [Paenibacillus macerans]|nr:hypothetical protein HMSSN036_67210 [Paenibacillus macerans]
MEFELAIELIGAVKRGRRKMIGPLNLQIPAGLYRRFGRTQWSGKKHDHADDFADHCTG